MQSEFDNFEPFVPANEAWAKLKPQLDQEQKKRRGIIWWWFTGFAIVAAISGGLFIYTTQEKTLLSNKTDKQNVVIPSEEKPSSKNINSTNKETNTEQNQIHSSNNNDIVINDKKSLTSNTAKPNLQTNNKKQNTTQGSLKKEVNGNSNNKPKSFFVAAKKPKTGLNNQQQINNSNPLSPSSAGNKQEDPNNNIAKQEVTSKSSTPTNQIDESPKSATAPTKNPKIETIASATSQKDSKPKKEINQNKNWQYGFQWNIPFTKNVNFLNVNRTNNPAIVFIPSIYAKKPFGNRSSVEVYFNPYSTHYINNKTVMQQNNYDIIIAQGSRVITNTYTQTYAANKLTSSELGLFYGYNVTKQLMLRAGVSYNFSNWAMVNTTVLRNGTDVMLDTLYSITKGNNMWSAINPTFMLGKFDVLYSFNKLELGVNFTTPLKPLTNLPNDNTPVNSNLFMRWRLR